MLLEIDRLSVRYKTRRGVLSAVDQLSLDVGRGETLGLVGESGCGKSSLGKAIVRLIEPAEGAVRLDGQDLGRLTRRQWLAWRRRMQMVFQDPLSALDPRKSVRRTLTLPLEVHRIGTSAERRERVDALLHQVGLAPALAERMPHELSGGQRQRVNIARALSLDPDVLICDEPVSALDVSLQAQVLNLLSDLQRERAITCLFISHDLAAVGYLADRIAVMYLGQIVEILPADHLWRHAAHPYTQLLIDSIPTRGAQLPAASSAELPDPFAPPRGCRFQQRCPHAQPVCSETPPALLTVGASHAVACHLYGSAASARVAVADIAWPVRRAAQAVNADGEPQPETTRSA
ncbi:oligopeptide/dipeptide ABC transporter, ATP-binding protein [Burkholderia sp. Ch1-1]|uniref:Oligopeptide transporter subunit ATP-binding component of ABC superfamily n=1 Tax=Paraburkholderia dioscoreae TaxID=2604047 RepID=A0A5Q4YX95_9BURK|nr:MULTISPECIES: ABC transporter ATP-binding protein [Paraburkholderia]EIF33134.1 oligopeptide/dipeptide ABC transporter, ATP-binding protein [Burkholderia sp. Ch1-1]MDR8401311.1 ABC transporter ATP-binding protein [Paraburkholderia sp. USG1]VVD31952.1 oligopeptide transporter subunit; ATP-binding component of ABC superfamily [Paraburkholderia dioscoreae]